MAFHPVSVGVAVFGSIAQDMYLYIRGGFSLGSSRVAEEFKISAGGSAANTAVALSRLGIQVGFAGAVGNDDAGHFLIEDLRNEGVDTTTVQVIDGRITSRVYVIVDLDTGERGMVGIRDAGRFFELREDVVDYIVSARYLHVSGYMLENEPGRSRTIELMELVKRKGKEVVTLLDLTQEVSDKGLIREIGKNIDYLLGNESEFLFLGCRPREEELRKVQEELGCKGLVVKLGDRGSIAYVSGELYHKGAFDVPVIDTTGAGDAFNAGFIYGLVKGYDIDTCLEIGNAAGAYACTGMGARHLPRKEDLEKILGYRLG